MKGLRIEEQGGSSAMASYFAELAQGWVSRYETQRSFQARLAILGPLVDRYVGPDARVLDYGSGAGIFSLVASRRAALVLSLDISEMMQRAAQTCLEQAIDLVNRTGQRCRPASVHRVVGDLQCLDEKRCQFDVILAIAVLEYLDDPARVFATFRRIIHPDGVIIFSVPRPTSFFRRVEGPTNRVLSTVGRVTRSQRFYDRRYTQVQPRRSSQPLDRLFEPQQLLEEVPLPLGMEGWRRHVRPSAVFAVRPVGT
jgi:SAM-dependent methyltransferase